MKRNRLIWLFSLMLLTGILGLVGCSGSKVQLTSFSPSGEVDALSTFEFEFDQALAPPDQQNEWLDEAFITFEPAIQGKFKWISDNHLIFSPEQSLLPGVDYQATITEKVFFGQKLKGDFEAISFNTPYFDATRVDFFWTQVEKSDYK